MVICEKIHNYIMMTSSEKERFTKTLIDNWVEERRCQKLGLEKDNYNSDGTLCTKLHRQGHKGILSTETNVPVESVSTVASSYLPPAQCCVPTTGKRNQLLTQQVYQLIAEEAQQASEDLSMQKMDTLSVTKQDFHKAPQFSFNYLISILLDFTPTQLEPSTTHSLNEPPATYWNSNIHQVTGVSLVCNAKSPFSKNTAFSIPIEHYLDQPKP